MSKPNSNLTSDVLKEHLSYDPDTGIFIRKTAWYSFSVGDIAGCCNGEKNYIRIRVAGKRFLAHRLAWLYVYGEWPPNQIDHINCDKTDNRICNLRSVDQSGNMQNRKVPMPHGASGHLGVTKSRNKWAAQIVVNRRHIHLGRFATPEEAHKAYLKAKRELHGTCTI